MSTVLLIFYILLFFWVLKRWRFFSDSGITTTRLWLIFSIKLVIGFGLTWLYTAYYTNRLEADIFKYFDDSEVMYNTLYSNPVDFFKMLFGYGNDNQYFYSNYYVEMNNWNRVYDFNAYNDSRTIIRVNAAIRFISFGNFHVHTLIFTILSMIGFTAIFKTFKKLFTNKIGAFTIAVFLIPSVIFWSSGALKESILIFGMGILIYSMNKLLEKKLRSKHLLIFISCIIFLCFIKFYVIIALIPCIIAYIITVKLNIKRPILVYLPIVFLCSILALNSVRIPPHYDFVETIAHKQKDFIRLAEVTDSGSQFKLTKLEPSFTGIAKVVPEALLNCFIRPLPRSGKSLVYLPSIIENIIILLSIFLAIFSIFKRKVTLTVEAKNMVWFSLVFTMLLFTIIGLTTPVSGALVRYKIPAMPFLGIAILTFINIDYLVEKIPFFKFLK